MSSSAILERIRTLLEQTPPFHRLPEQERDHVLSDVSVEYFQSGEVVLEQGTTVHKGLYIVESGMVRLMDMERQRLLRKCGEGESFGSFILLKGGGLIYEAKAVEPTVCAVLKSERFQELYGKYEDFAAYFDSDLMQYVRRIGTPQDVSGGHVLFKRQLSQLIHREPLACTPETTIHEAARSMRRENVGTMLVLNNGRLVGIITDSDLRNKVVAQGRPLDTPVRRVMSSPVITVSADANLFDAMMVMLNRRIHRLVITRAANKKLVPVGILTYRDVAHFRGLDPAATAQRIETAPSLTELVDVREETSEQLLRLYRQGVQPEMLDRIMAVLYDGIAIRVLELTEKELRAKQGEKHVDLRWAWLRLGSGGRQEMALNSVQHNALIYADPSDEAEAAAAEAWFNRLAGHANEALAACGFMPSDVVARSGKWRKALRAWKGAYREWILQSNRTELGEVPFFFDIRAIYGDAGLLDALKEDLVDALNVQALDGERKLLTLMASNAIQKRPPSTFLRRLGLELTSGFRNTIDIREGGILPVVDAARILALETRYLESTNTFARLRHTAEAIPELSKTIEAALGAYQYIVDFRLERQLTAVDAGEPPDNIIDPAVLTRMQQHLLRDAFTAVEDLQEALARRYDVRRGWRS